MLACQSSLSPKVFGQTSLQNCILPLLFSARVQTVPVPFCVQDLRVVAVQAIHNSPSSRAWHRGYSMLLPSSIVRLVLLSTLCSQCPRVRRIFAVSLENLFELGRH